ncbi:hypothetical protein CIB95_11725 [Lottiidibacillus patelloidae]|uniref:HNH endonuclease n=1 Tax=Lottiidibacillus patelloidae TaxID=2670334 RepID=A0A263BSU2_9BACI|nr:HNH endonuclease [Lottiidibacillus patelloidae]OZM56437.1 hypothetical protein CIB95_11725 [Lottiidibacillus patelloidae]
MFIFRKVGKITNSVVGGAAEGGVNLFSKVVSTKNDKVGNYINEVGTSVINASKSAVDSVGQFADGAVRTSYGAWKKDDSIKQQGWSEMKDSTVRTVRGIGTSVKYTFHNGKVVYRGLRTNDRGQIVEGLKNLGKVAAVTTFAVGIIDILDGTDHAEAKILETRNDHLQGLEHSETGVPFQTKVIELSNGDVIEGTFPVFESKFTVVLTEEVYEKSDRFHFSVANDVLYESIQGNPTLANELGLSSSDIVDISQNTTPEGYVWHHSEDPGVLQLVNEESHSNTGHTGGREIWGGGGEKR